MDKISVKFNKKGAGLWSDSPAESNFEVKEGDVKEVSINLAKGIEAAGKGKIVQSLISDEPEEGSECELASGKKGVIEDGVCVKKGFIK